MLTAFALGLAAVTTAKPLDDLLSSPALKGGVVGVVVQDHLGRTVLEHDADTRVMPASNNKLLTVAYALHALTPNYRARTHFYREGNEVWVDALGDPTISYKDLQAIGERLKITSRTPVRVRQRYSPGVPQGWNHGYLTARYAAQIEAFSVDRGGFELWADSKGVKLEPDSYGVKVAFKPATHNLRFSYDLVKKVIAATGQLPAERTRLATLAVPDPSEAACKALGGRQAGTFEQPPDRLPDATLESPSMAEMASLCLQPSDNNIAEHLLLLAALESGPLAEDPYPQATDRLVQFLASTVGVHADHVRPWDGSGLSRHDLVTARALAQVLRWGIEQPWGQIWLDAQAKSGAPGTLANRLKDVDFRGKTGYIDSVTSLSGYLVRKAGGVWVVSVVCNNFKRPPSEVRQAIDQFIAQIATMDEFGPELGITSSRGSIINALLESRPSSGHWSRGPDFYGGLARPWLDRGNESGHAAVDRVQ